MPATNTRSVSRELVLNTAAQRSDHMVLPLPPALKARGAAQQTLLGGLVKAALIEELSVSDGALFWRREADGRQVGLRLTADGLAAVRGQNAPEKARRKPGAPPGQDTPSPRPTAEPSLPEDLPTAAEAHTAPLKERARPGGKLGQVLDAIAGETGVSLVELVALTGWQPHTARAALSGLRKRGFSVQLMERDGRKAYRFEVAI